MSDLERALYGLTTDARHGFTVGMARSAVGYADAGNDWLADVFSAVASVAAEPVRGAGERVDLALDLLTEDDRRVFTCAMAAARDRAVSSSDHRLAAVFSALAVAAAESTDRLAATFAALDFTPGLTIVEDTP